MQQQPATSAQQEAIREVRSRYERGELSFEQFRYALNAILQAQTPEQCQAIVSELPAATQTSVFTQQAQALTPVAPVAPLPTQRIVGGIGELKRMRRPWQMEPYTIVRLWMGQIKLDLSLAALPQQGILEVIVPVGEAIVYVPREVHVTVRAFALIGEAKAFGEERNGIFCHLNEEDYPPQGTPAESAPHLEIRLKTYMGSVKVMRVNGPVFGIKDMLKEAASQVFLATLDAVKQNRREQATPDGERHR
ncbi:MAG TPA: LiaF domain-containing protein [Ktedonobacterales bacterium]|jgi:hypothetical protein